MTARPLDPARWRRLASVVVALVLLLTVLLAAGCVEPAEQVTQVITTSVTPTIAMSDRELAEQTIADVEEQIKKTDTIIGWFKGNASTRDDPQLPAIIAKREIAMSFIVVAEDEIANRNFSQANIKAREAYAKADESYTEALKQQRSLTSDCQRGFLTMCL